jgi:hypothetical protein
MRRHNLGWYVTFAFLIVAAFLGIHYLTGHDAVGAASRFIWNAVAFAVNGLLRLVGGLALTLAKGVGLRRVSRLATLLTGVRLGYAGSVILSDARLKQARGWRGKVKATITLVRNRWQRLHIAWKLAIVAVLIASQVYLHFLLIIFPIAFLVPVVRRLWIQAADLMFGSWYWRTFGRMHRTVIGALQALPGWRQVFDAVRLWRIRYLCAWRLWKHDPRYRIAETNAREISFVEPLRLWWRGELDLYVGRPLLAGARVPRPDTIAGNCPSASAMSEFTIPRKPADAS